MLEHFDQDDLLALIEGELPPEQADQLRQQLAADPEAKALVEQYGQDRQLLRSTPVPDLPRDFIPEVEPMLVRPLLVSTPPGSYRRRHRRVARKASIKRWALAAAVFFVVGGALWMTMQHVIWPNMQQIFTPERQLATNTDTETSPEKLQPGTADQSPATSNTEFARAELSTGNVHHYPPALFTADEINNEQPLTPPDDPQQADTTLQPVQFALVFRDMTALEVEIYLQAGLAQIEQPLALVRNFNYQEALAMAETHRRTMMRQRANDPPGQPLTADFEENTTPIPPLTVKDTARHAWEQLLTSLEENERQAARANNQVLPSGQITGSAMLFPDFQQQLDYSSRGASWTMSLPVSDLITFLSLLDELTHHQTHLDILPDEADLDLNRSNSRSDEPTEFFASHWVMHQPLIRELLAQLDQNPQSNYILLPIVLQTESGN